MSITSNNFYVFIIKVYELLNKWVFEGKFKIPSVHFNRLIYIHLYCANLDSVDSDWKAIILNWIEKNT